MADKRTYEELEQKIKQLEKEALSRTHELEKLANGLDCFYGISKTWGKSHFSFEKKIQEIVDLIPASWPYPKITCAQVIIDDLKFITKNFKETDWKLSREIIVYGKLIGILDIFYLQKKPEMDEECFLKEERSLINAIAEQLGKITESERMEETIRVSEQKFSHIFKNNSTVMYLVDPETLKIVDANHAAENYYGFAHRNLLVKKLTDICLSTEAEIRKEIQKAGQENRDFFVFKHRLANGEIRDVEIRSTPIFLHENRLFNFLIVHDITDRIRAEEEKKKIESQLRQSHKMEALGTLSGGIAHDFNNILWIINGNTELAKAEIPQENPACYNLDKVEEACRRATTLVTHILSFSRQKEQKRQPLKISLIIKESLKLLRASIPANIDIHRVISSQSDVILADLSLLNQVFMNLYTNAVHAMGKNGGVLEVSLVDFEINKQEAALLHNLTSGNYLIMSVRDTGHGIDPENMERIFDPYFTTKGDDEGTGMGLSAAYGIIINHGGTITVDSKPGKGTIFNVFLPVYEEVEKEPDLETFKTLPSGKERILVVDDENSLLDMLNKMLTLLGYKVEVFQNPVEALKSFKTKPEKYDLVITDQSMPYITGDILAKELMNIRPDIPIILCTGYSELISEEEAGDIGIKSFLFKPVEKGKLARTIRKVLDQS